MYVSRRKPTLGPRASARTVSRRPLLPPLVLAIASVGRYRRPRPSPGTSNSTRCESSGAPASPERRNAVIHPRHAHIQTNFTWYRA